MSSEKLAPTIITGLPDDPTLVEAGVILWSSADGTTLAKIQVSELRVALGLFVPVAHRMYYALRLLNAGPITAADFRSTDYQFVSFSDTDTITLPPAWLGASRLAAIAYDATRDKPNDYRNPFDAGVSTFGGLEEQEGTIEIVPGHQYYWWTIGDEAGLTRANGGTSVKLSHV